MSTKNVSPLRSRGSWVIKPFFAFMLLGTASISAPAYAASSWQVTAQARAYANGSGGGGYFDESNVLEACNGTALYCPATRPSPVIYTHSNTLTSARLPANASGSYPALNSNPAGSSSGTAFAYADLATGELHVSNSGEVSGYASTAHHSQAGFQDNLHFSGLSSITDFTVKIHLDGIFLGYQQPNLGFSISDGNGSNLYLYQDWADLSATVPACVGTVLGCSNIAIQPANTNLTPADKWVKLGEGDYVGTLTYDPLHPDFAISMSLGAGGSGTSFSDFSHTAGITFSLPSGLTFTSDLNVFLTKQYTTDVPEPSTWAMLLGGFGAVGVAARRARRVETA